MRAFINYDFGLERIGRLRARRVWIGLNKNRQEFVGDLLRNPFDVGNVPIIEASLPRSERGIRHSPQFWLRFAETQDAAEGDDARLVILAPVGGRDIPGADLSEVVRRSASEQLALNHANADRAEQRGISRDGEAPGEEPGASFFSQV